MRPGKSPSSKRLTPKKEVAEQSSSATSPSILPHHFRKLRNICSQAQRISRLWARPKGFPLALWKPLVPVPCGNPCKLRSERVHPHHAGTKKHAFFLRRFPRTAAKAPTSTGTPRCFSGERERGFSQKSRLSPRSRFLTRGWQSRSSSAPCATSYWRDRRPSPRWY